MRVGTGRRTADPHPCRACADGSIASRDVDAGAGVGGGALSHDGQTPGCALVGPDRDGFGRRRVPDAGTGVG